MPVVACKRGRWLQRMFLGDACKVLLSILFILTLPTANFSPFASHPVGFCHLLLFIHLLTVAFARRRCRRRIIKVNSSKEKRRPLHRRLHRRSPARSLPCRQFVTALNPHLGKSAETTRPGCLSLVLPLTVSCLGSPLHHLLFFLIFA